MNLQTVPGETVRVELAEMGFDSDRVVVYTRET